MVQETQTAASARDILKNYFGYADFRSGQEEIVDSILSRKDVLAVMPTGAGKSICYQVPALIMEGITLVISPLISLMQDQVKALNEAGIYAAYINSSLSEGQIHKVLKLAAEGRFKIIYVAPERLENNAFREFCRSVDISMVTIDEAHCISQWGQDFRPSYLSIPGFIAALSKRPVVSAFTATATPQVRDDILAVTGLIEPFVHVAGFDRANLYFDVERPESKDSFALDYVKDHREESGIIYCATRKHTEALFELLFKNGIAVSRYHAGLSPEIRKESQDSFIYDKTPVMVATNAFGMGIDKSNVRYVIHYNMPSSMENYYQEAGRAGRDGEPAKCILLFSGQDIVINRFLLERKTIPESEAGDEGLIRERDMARLNAMIGYCKSVGCLRKFILRYFGEKNDQDCDNCGNCHNDFLTKDMTAEAKWVVNATVETKGRYGISVVCGILRGANRAKLREIGAFEFKSYGKLKDLSESELRDLIDEMISCGYIRQTEGQYPLLVAADYAPLKDSDTRVMVRYIAQKPRKEHRKKAYLSDRLTSAGFQLFAELKSLRMEIAREESIPPYIVFSDRTLIDMCTRLPQTPEEMLSVSGVGIQKNEKYGKRFLACISDFRKLHPDEVLSEKDEPQEILSEPEKNEPQDIPSEPEKKTKPDFSMNKGDGQNFHYSEYLYASEIAKELNAASTKQGVKKATYKDVWGFLEESGLIVETEDAGKTVRYPTEKGLQEGIILEDRVGKNEEPYKLVRYPEKVQRIVVEAFDRGAYLEKSEE